MTGASVWREGFVPGGETRFWVRALGHGDDVVMLLHGWPEHGGMWDRVAPLLADAGYRVIAPDLKGFGRSEAGDRDYGPETLADEISQLIRNLHARKAALVGHDWGGAVALATAFRHPGRVRSVVLASSPYRELDLVRAWHIPLLNLPVLPELAFRHLPGPLVRAAVGYASRSGEPFDRERLDGYAEAVGADPSAWLAYYRTMSRQALVERTLGPVRRRLGGGGGPRPVLRVPAHVVWGADDPVLPLAIGRRVAEDLGAGMTVIPDAGHFLPEEDPLGFSRAVAGFLGPAGAHRVDATA